MEEKKINPFDTDFAKQIVLEENPFTDEIPEETTVFDLSGNEVKKVVNE